MTAVLFPDPACAHERRVTCGIDLVCVGCGLVLDVNPFECGSVPDAHWPLHCCSVIFRSELAAAARELGVPAEQSLLRELSRGARPSGRLRYAAVARLYSHCRDSLPLEHVLSRLGLTLRALTGALVAEGVYDDEPIETLIDFGIRRTGAPREARAECLALVAEWPGLCRWNLVALGLAEWVGEEASGLAMGIQENAMRAYAASLERRRDAQQ